MINYNNIPEELQTLRQWINWRYEVVNEKQTKVPLRCFDTARASVTNSLDWSSFDNAVSRLQHTDGIGFVFTLSDPFCGTDLDYADGDDEIQAKQNQVYYDLASYSELSPSGKGLHIICRAKLPGAGRRRNKIEIYDSNRFFTFTGDTVNSNPIAEKQNVIETLYNSLNNFATETENFVASEPQTIDDATVIARCLQASNGEKFARLFAGNWQSDYGHQSQSEADFALLNIIVFNTRCIEQATRIFLQSGLGQRAKAKRNAFVPYSRSNFAYVPWMIQRAFDRMPPKADLDALYNQRLEVIRQLGVK